MTKASDILKRYKNLSEGEEQVGGKPKKGEKVGDGGRSPLGKIVEKLIKENFSKDNDTQKKAADDMGKLAEADDKMANKFMKHMDESASKFKLDEALKDVSDGDGQDADDMDTEEGGYKKGGKKGEPAKKTAKK